MLYKITQAGRKLNFKKLNRTKVFNVTLLKRRPKVKLTTAFCPLSPLTKDIVKMYEDIY